MKVKKEFKTKGEVGQYLTARGWYRSGGIKGMTVWRHPLKPGRLNDVMKIMGKWIIIAR